MPTDDVIAWLLDGDVAVEHQARRDLLGHDVPDLQRRIAREGAGAALLAARGPSGHWGRGFYRPKWTSSHYTLLELARMGLPRDHPDARATVQLILTHEVGRDGGLNPTATIRQSDACVNGMALGYAAWFGAPAGRLVTVVDFLLGRRVVDGGFNCRANRVRTVHSSLHTTVSVVEGITEYLRQGYEHRADELRDARATAVEFMLRHRLFRSERTGEVIRPEFLRPHHPTRWHYDVLRGLEALRAAGVPHDRRMADALDDVVSHRRPDGRWQAARPYPGVVHPGSADAATRDRWVTLEALRTLRHYRPDAL